jgi:lysophospholipase L1-like esterase
MSPLPSIAAWALALVAWAGEPVVLAPFADGEVVVFVGDSITHDGRWHRCIADFYATRYPDRHIVFINAGIAGDNASGTLLRVDADVLRWKPSTAVVMLGMNDCGRDAYRPGSDTDQQMLAIRERSLTNYHDNMLKLATQLRAATRHLILITPSPYEDTAKLIAPNLPGANGGLRRGAEMVSGIADSTKAALVDVHAPMTAMNLDGQRQDPAFSLIGPDRVHPASPGHLVMAWLLLKAQGVPALVSRTEIDAKTRSAQAEHAAVSAATFSDGSITFTLAGKCLPFPITDDARPALAYTSIEADLDREELMVANLADGLWRIEIDGAAIGNYGAADLGKGVNLALVNKTPQYRQALLVQMMNEERRNLEQRLRSVAMVEYRLFKSGEVDLSDPAKVMAAIDQRLAAKPAEWIRKVLEECRSSRAQVPALREQVLAMSETIRLAAQPKPHTYRIIRAH